LLAFPHATDWKPFDDVGSRARGIRIRDAMGIYRVTFVCRASRCFRNHIRVSLHEDATQRKKSCPMAEQAVCKTDESDTRAPAADRLRAGSVSSVPAGFGRPKPGDPLRARRSLWR
jgi:hypothetical protein